MSASPVIDKREREPDTPANVLVGECACIDRHEQRAEVLDEQGDPDREPVDREEVEELHERDARNAEDGEAQELARRRRERSTGFGRSRQHASPIKAPAQRASVSRSDESPDERATFATDPLMPKSVAATSTMT